MDTVVSISNLTFFQKSTFLIFIGITGGPVPDVYQFLQCHIHWGSNDLEGAEHVVDGVRLPGEVRGEMSMNYLEEMNFSFILSHGIQVDIEQHKKQLHLKNLMV